MVLITGSGSGIGRLMALRFGELGSTLVLWDIDEASIIKGAQNNMPNNILEARLLQQMPNASRKFRCA